MHSKSAGGRLPDVALGDGRQWDDDKYIGADKDDGDRDGGENEGRYKVKDEDRGGQA